MPGPILMLTVLLLVLWVIVHLIYIGHIKQLRETIKKTTQYNNDLIDMIINYLGKEEKQDE